MSEIKITSKENGPYLVPGNATYTDAEGNQQNTGGGMVALCRCGVSANKPFCDGSHKKISFTAAKIELILTPKE